MVHFIWPVMTVRRFSLALTKVDIQFVQNVCDALPYLLDNIYIRSGTKLCKQIDGIRVVQIVPLSKLIYFIPLRKRFHEFP